MSTKTIIGLLVAIVVIGGGAWYFSSKGTDNHGALMGTDEQKSDSSGDSTFAELIGRAGSWKCTVKTSVEEAPSEGVAYIANGNVRADFTSKPQALGGKEVATAMIQRDGYIYTWSSMMPQGIKMKVPDTKGDTTNGQSGAQGFDYTSKVQYSCGPWATDDSLFTPPGDISFMELGAQGMPQGMPSGMPSGYPTVN